MLDSRFSLFTYFIHSTVYMSAPISQFFPPPPHPRPFPPWYPYICSLHLCLYFCFVNKIGYTNFFQTLLVSSHEQQDIWPLKKQPYCQYGDWTYARLQDSLMTSLFKTVKWQMCLLWVPCAALQSELSCLQKPCQWGTRECGACLNEPKQFRQDEVCGHLEPLPRVLESSLKERKLCL